MKKNIKYFRDSYMYHLTPNGQEGFDIPEELWKEYLECRNKKEVYKHTFYKVMAEILMFKRNGVPHKPSPTLKFS